MNSWQFIFQIWFESFSRKAIFIDCNNGAIIKFKPFTSKPLATVKLNSLTKRLEFPTLEYKVLDIFLPWETKFSNVFLYASNTTYGFIIAKIYEKNTTLNQDNILEFWSRRRFLLSLLFWTRRVLLLPSSLQLFTHPSLWTRWTACSRSKRKLSWWVYPTSLFSAITNTVVPSPAATTPRFGDRV